jgi:hypothetical protein
MLISLVLLPCILLFDRWQGALCPPSTFAHGMSRPSEGMAVAIILGMICLLALAMAVMTRLNAWTYADGARPRPTGRTLCNIVIAAAICGLSVSAWLYTDAIKSYFCVTPTQIVIRSGVFSSVRILTWSDVRVVHATCWKDKPRKAKPYFVATLRLFLDDGESIPIGLVDGGIMYLDRYNEVRQALAGKKYRYLVNASVTPELCPAGLYPRL